MFIYNEFNDREKREMKANNFFIFNGEDEKDILTEDFNNNTTLITPNESNNDELVSKRSENGPITINDKGKHHTSSFKGRNKVLDEKSTRKSKENDYQSYTNSHLSSTSSGGSHKHRRSPQSSEVSSLCYDKAHRGHHRHSRRRSNSQMNSNKIQKNNKYASTTSGLTSRPNLSRLEINPEVGQNGVYHHHRRHHHHRHHHRNHKSQHRKNNLSNSDSNRNHYSSSNMSSLSNNKRNEKIESSDTDASYSSEATSSSSIYTPSIQRNASQYTSMNFANQNISNYRIYSNEVSRKELNSSSQLFSDFVPMEYVSASKLNNNSNSKLSSTSNNNINYNNYNNNYINPNSRCHSNNFIYNSERGPSLFGFNSNMSVIPEVEVVKANVMSKINVSEIPEEEEEEKEEEEEVENDDDMFESRDFSEIYNPVINPSKVKAKSDIHLLNKYNSKNQQRFKGSLNSASQFLHLPKNLKKKVVSSPSKFETNYYTISYRKAIPRSEWKPDNSTDHCKICNRKFNLIIRRHHCRLCGFVFCNSCCHRKIPLIIDDNNANSENFKKYFYNMFNSNTNCNASQSSDKFKGSSASECLSSILEIYQNKNNFLVCPIQCKICENCFTKYYIN